MRDRFQAMIERLRHDPRVVLDEAYLGPPAPPETLLRADSAFGGSLRKGDELPRPAASEPGHQATT